MYLPSQPAATRLAQGPEPTPSQRTDAETAEERVSKLWTKARRQAKQRREEKRMLKYQRTLEYQLCEALQGRTGERGHNEGAVDTLYRIIGERDDALMILALDRIRDFRQSRFPML